MINHTSIDFRNDRLVEIQAILDRLAPHEHTDGMNECAICDQQLDEAILIELRKAEQEARPVIEHPWRGIPHTVRECQWINCEEHSHVQQPTTNLEGQEKSSGKEEAQP